VVAFPNCKINLGLNIIAKRADGFHNLETIFYPIAINDVLEIVQQSNATTDVELVTSGLAINGDATNNLCVKAYHLLHQDFPGLPPIKMHLHKVIPMGAGLGGGSADGAFALTLLNQKFNLGISQEALIDYALQLGSDCPFFILNQPCFAESRGEIMQPLTLDLSAWQFFIINTGIHINTGWAFSQITPAPPKKSASKIIAQPIETWKQELVNDFEAPVFNAHPALAEIKANLYQKGAVYASMSGSGSTLYGIFPKSISLLPLQQQYANFLTRVVY